jgi:succinate-acetate transporter protein
MRTSGAVFLVLLTLTITLAAATAGSFAQSANTIKATGFEAIITADLWRYMPFAAAVNATWEKDVLPVWPFDK